MHAHTLDLQASTRRPPRRPLPCSPLPLSPLPNPKALDLTANRLHHVEPKIQELTGLTRLCLRQNLLSDPSEVELLRSAPVLLHLELRDNQLPVVPNLHAFSSLTYLERS